MTGAIMIATIIGAVMVEAMEDGEDEMEDAAPHGVFTLPNHLALLALLDIRRRLSYIPTQLSRGFVYLMKGVKIQ